MPRKISTLALLFGAAVLIRGNDSSAAVKKATRRPDPAAASVESALRAEVTGQTDRREQLARTLRERPDSAAAHWQAGYLRDAQGWRSFDEVSQASAESESVKAYLARRQQAPKTAEGQLDLANWCRKQGFFDQERAHLYVASVVNPGPQDPAVLQRLGYRNIGSQWVSPDQVRDWSQARNETESSLKKWAGRVERIAVRMTGTKSQQATALADVRAINDPSAVPAIEYILAGRDLDAGLAAVETLQRIAGPEASLALTKQGVFSKWPDVRKSAAEALRGRRFDDFVPSLISLLAAPSRGEFRLIHDAAQGMLSYNYIAAIETEDQFQVATLRVIDQVIDSTTGAAPGNQDGANNRRTVELADAAARARAGTDSLRSVRDRAEIHEREQQATLDRIQELNDRVGAVLAAVSGKAPSADARLWWQWWSDLSDSQLPSSKQVVVSEEFETSVTEYTPAVIYDEEPFSIPRWQPPRVARSECFAAGTPVWTDRGLLAIEKVAVGDRVLSKDIETGEVTYKPVLQTTVRPPRLLTTLRIGNEILTCTGGHRFWQSGLGWVKSRDLEPQSLVHTVTGNAPVWSAKSGDTAETYNLVVADFHTYFVTPAGVLSQDVLIPRGTRKIVPGLSFAKAEGQ